jgi:hypothetical protein
MVTAPTGQMDKQAPQPVQDCASTRACATPPGASVKRIAECGQASWQLRHTIPWAERQVEPTAAAISQGRAAARSKTGAGQASAQAPQKLHSPRPKSTSGKPPSPGRRMPSGQAPWQAPQRVHSEVNRSSRDQGGRIVGGEALVRPRRNHRRRISTVSWVMTGCRSAQTGGGPGGPMIICDIQTRNPYPPTTATARNGQITNASRRKMRISRRFAAESVGVACDWEGGVDAALGRGASGRIELMMLLRTSYGAFDRIAGPSYL